MLLRAIPEAITRDRARPLVALACLAFLAVSGARYAAIVKARTDWIEACLAAPDPCDGRRVFLSLVDVESLHDDGYTVRKVLTPIRVLGDPSRRKVGSTISLTARFEAGRGLVEVEPIDHPNRQAKKILGNLGVLGMLVALSRGVRFTRQGLVLRG